MKSGKLKVARGSDNVLHDLGRKSADAETWLAELTKIPADLEFMKERGQPKTPKRQSSDELPAR